ncbi:MAG: 3'-5' exonuclease [Succinivibrionaceae bacterium]|nr:3'-5' exonuclease [Succinivibrionaceae bacterium]
MSRSKSNYTRQLIDDYCVVDTETTGKSAKFDSVIEIALLRVRNNQIVDQYTQLVFPENQISSPDNDNLLDPFITQLTGITNDMIRNAPRINEIQDQALSFIGDDVLLGHNTSFDIRFLNAGFKRIIENKYMDTLHLSRKVYPDFISHKLPFLTDQLGLSKSEHRALADCVATKELYDNLKNWLKAKIYC